jgi:hypothetical protein
MFDAFWRACGYCLHWRVIAWSLLPLLLAGSVLATLGYVYWGPAVGAVRGALEQWELTAALLRWVESIGAPQLRALVAPLIVVALATPLIVVGTLLLVAWIVTPAVVRMFAARRFPALERREGTPWWRALGWSLACSASTS